MSKNRETDERDPTIPASAGEADGQAPAEQPAAAGDALAELMRERDDLLARLQRVSADYVNYQKRVQRDIDAARSFANESLIKALLAVLDDVERALEAGRAGHDENDPLLTGMELVHDKALETLDRFGLTAIEAEGKPFDPELHSAMMQQPSDVHPPQTVLTELVRGYRLKGRTIRPSGVVISSAPEPPDGAEGLEIQEPTDEP